jgi:protein TonB
MNVTRPVKLGHAYRRRLTLIPKLSPLFVSLLGLAPSLALAQSTDSPRPQPAAQAPSQNPLAEFYPERAQRMDVEGDAKIRCRVTTTGALASCVVVSESPVGYNFGVATLHASTLWHVKPPMRDGVPVEGVITIPVAWRLAHRHPPIAPPAP